MGKESRKGWETREKEGEWEIEISENKRNNDRKKGKEMTIRKKRENKKWGNDESCVHFYGWVINRLLKETEMNIISGEKQMCKKN